MRHAKYSPIRGAILTATGPSAIRGTRTKTTDVRTGYTSGVQVSHRLTAVCLDTSCDAEELIKSNIIHVNIIIIYECACVYNTHTHFAFTTDRVITTA